MKVFKSTLFILVMLVACLYGYGQSLTFVSDGSWACATSVHPGWANVVYPYETTDFTLGSFVDPPGRPSSGSCLHGTVNEAYYTLGGVVPSFMWIGPDGTNPNTNPAAQAFYTNPPSVTSSMAAMFDDNAVYFKKHFSLISTNVTCQDLSIFADDYAEVYINGTLIANTYTDASNVSTWHPVIISGAEFRPGGRFEHVLTCGDNVITLVGQNGRPYCYYVVFSWALRTIDYDLTTSSVNPTSCSGTGSVSASITPPTSGDTYTWSNDVGATVGTGSTVSGLLPGTYTVAAYSAGTSCTAHRSVTIVPATSTMSVTASGVNPTDCHTPGSATASVSGTTNPVSYTWSNTLTPTSPATTYSNTQSGLPPGIYTVTVTDGACQKTASVTLSSPSSTLSVTLTPSQPTCTTGVDGSVTATVTGVSDPVSYVWSNGDNTLNSSIYTNTIGSLAPDLYTVTVTDDLCQTVESVTLSASGLAYTLTVTPGACPSPAAAASITSTGSGYTYLWTKNGATVGTTSGITNLSAGLYEVQVSRGGCTATEDFHIYPPSNPGFSGNMSSIAPTCNNNGSVSIDVTPAGSYTYEWSTGTPVNTPTVNPTNSTLNNVGGGLYQVTVTSTANTQCYIIKYVSLDQPTTSFTVTATKTDLTCSSEGLATATVSSGASGTLNYTWSNTSSTDVASLTNSIPIWSPGLYSVTVTNSTGCSASAEVSLLREGDLAISVSGVDPVCNQPNSGTATATILNGSGPYTYTWSTTATTSTGSTSNTISGLSPATYSVTVSSGTYCTRTASVVLNAPVNCCVKPTASLIVNGSSAPVDTICYKDSLRAYISGAHWGKVYFDGGDSKDGWDTLPEYTGNIIDDPSVIGTTHQVCLIVTDDTTSTCADTICRTIYIKNCCTKPDGIFVLPDTICGGTVDTIGIGGAPYFRFLADGNNPIDNPGALPTDTFNKYFGGLPISPGGWDVGVHHVCVIYYSDDPDQVPGTCIDTVCRTIVVRSCGCEVFRGQTLPVVTQADGFVYDFTNTSGGDFAPAGPDFINWYVDGKLVGQTTDGNHLTDTLTPGTHEICMDAAHILFNAGPNGNSICCYDRQCTTVNIDACISWKATDSITYSYDTADYRNVIYSFHGSTSPLSPTIVWHFGDGSSTIGHDLTVSHHYSSDNDYTVCAVVIWSKGDSITYDSLGVCCCVDTICLPIAVSPCSITDFGIALTADGDDHSYHLTHSAGMIDVTYVKWTVATEVAASTRPEHGVFMNFTGSDAIYTVCAKIDYTITLEGGLTQTCTANVCISDTFGDALTMSRVRTYPNPTSGDVVIEITNYQSGKDAQIDIYDMTGQIVMTSQLTAMAKGTSQNVMNVRKLPAGIYTVRVTIDDMRQVSKLIKQ
ncbi:MAG: T9SS type A sorting domain-containing protein [Bacteroidetes bacterium]|nr:T9SS type A sorting domain-containing protein [Bacteroidota bacterium]